jgi:uncharacterized protein YcaQ
LSITISSRTARRYVLGRQGLWPGRRWSGRAGTEQALRQCECVQIDTINAVARNHDLKLAARVEGYVPAMLDALLYTDRRFFEFGSILMVYPADEMSYWRAVMRRQSEERAESIAARQAVVEHVRQEIASRGPLSSRDFVDRERVRGGFNTMKDSAIALYLLWISGEIVTRSRRGFDRVYDLACRIEHPAWQAAPASESDAADYFARKAMRDMGLATPSEWARRARVYLHRYVDGPPAKVLEALAEEGYLTAVTVGDRKEQRWALAEDVPLLHSLEVGLVPEAWAPSGPTTEEEVTFIAPLDNVIWDRARTKALFDFDYVWEVYKPQSLRKWGYYTLPILYGDQLVGRFAPRLNRKTGTLAVEGFWMEDEALAASPEFRAALAAAIRRFAEFHNAANVDPGPMAAALSHCGIRSVRCV